MGVLDERETETSAKGPAKERPSIRSPLAGRRDAFWMRAGRWRSVRSWRTRRRPASGIGELVDPPNLVQKVHNGLLEDSLRTVDLVDLDQCLHARLGGVSHL
jgi:hypothetical protein